MLLALSRVSRAFVVTPPTAARSPTARTMVSSILDLLGGAGKNQLITPEKALPGRDTPILPKGTKHYIYKENALEDLPKGGSYQEAIYANGCFWGSEKGAWRFPFGIYSTAVGYCGGFTPNPTYEEACSGLTGHTEGVRVVYDESKISYVDVIRWFWEAHDPTSGMGQGNDRGTQYRSGCYYNNEEQKALVEASKEAYEKVLGRPITTEIAAASDYDKYGGCWYFAEEYHQQYLAKPGARPYCSAQPQGIALPPYDEWCPFEDETLREKHRPKLPESFWKEHAPQKGCSVVAQPNEPIVEGSYAS